MNKDHFSFDELSDELEPQYVRKRKPLKESVFRFSLNEEEDDDSNEPEGKNSAPKTTLQKLLDEKDKDDNLHITSDVERKPVDDYQNNMLEVFSTLPMIEKEFFFQNMKHNSSITSFNVWKKTYSKINHIAAVAEIYKIYFPHHIAFGIMMIDPSFREGNTASMILKDMINACVKEKIECLRIEVPENNRFYANILKGFDLINKTTNCDVYEKKISNDRNAIKENLDLDKFSF